MLSVQKRLESKFYIPPKPNPTKKCLLGDFSPVKWNKFPLDDVRQNPLKNSKFNCVSLCKSNSNELVCIKQVNLCDNRASSISMIQREIYIMSQLRHPHVIRMIKSFPTFQCMNIVMEYASNGSLRDIIIKKTSAFSEKEVQKIFCDILMGLEYLHIRHVIHRDLKPENVLIGKDGKAKIGDFGISCVHNRSQIIMEPLGTPLYLAPEVLKGKPYGFKADIWSLGCIFFELCTLRNPFEEAKDREQLIELVNRKIVAKILCEEKLHSTAFRVLCEQMLTNDPEKRSSIPELVANPFVMMFFYNKYFEYFYMH